MQPNHAIAIARRRFAVRLSLFYATGFAVVGAYTPFFPVWLKARGLDPAWIGIVMAMPTLARLTAVPVVTHGVERRSITSAILAASVLTAVGFALVATMPTTLTIAGMLLLTAFAWTPLLPLTDAYALRGVAAHAANYGPIRLWGSAAYIAGVLAAGFVATVVAAEHLIWVIVAIALSSAICAVIIEPLEPAAPKPVAASASTALLRQPAFIAILAASALIQGSHAAYYGFSSISWQAQGMSSTTISLLWAICVLAEIVLFALSPRLGLSGSALLIAGGFGGALRWAVTATEPSLAVLAVMQTLHALSFGATHLGTMDLLSRRIPEHSLASAQGALSASGAIVSATASVLAGSLFGAYGQSIYYGAAVMAGVGGLIMLLARRTFESPRG